MNSPEIFPPFATLYQANDIINIKTGKGSGVLRHHVADDMIGLRNDQEVLRSKDPDSAEMIAAIKDDIFWVNSGIILAEQEIKSLYVRRKNLKASLAFHQARLA